MGSYLETYGLDEARRAKRLQLIKRVSIIAVVVLCVALIFYGIFKNHFEEAQVKNFIGLLRQGNYPAAYAMWGCSASKPCDGYAMTKFMQDWGPNTPHANATEARIGMSQSCGTGVILRVDYPGAESVPLWVERDSKVIGFAPWPECPGRHLHIGTWLRSLFHR